MKYPLAPPQPETEFFWSRLSQREFWLRRCDTCIRPHFYPRGICPFCGSTALSWTLSRGHARIHAFAIVERPPSRFFKDSVPYCPILAELDEGVVVPGQLIQDDPSPDTVHVGLRVRLIFKEVVVGRWIYLFSALPPGKN